MYDVYAMWFSSRKRAKALLKTEVQQMMWTKSVSIHYLPHLLAVWYVPVIAHINKHICIRGRQTSSSIELQKFGLYYFITYFKFLPWKMLKPNHTIILFQFRYSMYILFPQRLSILERIENFKIKSLKLQRNNLLLINNRKCDQSLVTT